MKITQVVIENFRKFNSRTEINFENYSALVGENGSGKTSIIEAVNLATTKYFVGSKISESDFNNQDNIRILVEFDKLFAIEVLDGWTNILVPCKQVLLIVGRRKQAAALKALNDGYIINHFAIPYTYSNIDELTSLLQDLEIKDKIPPAIVQIGNSDEYKYELKRKSPNAKPKQVDSRALQVSNNLIGFPNVFYFSKDRAKETTKRFGNLMSRIIQDFNWRYISKNEDESIIVNRWDEYYNLIINSIEKDKEKRIIGPLRRKLEVLTLQNFDNLELSLINLKEPFTDSFLTLRNQNETKQIKVAQLGSGESIMIAYSLLSTISELSKENVIYLIDEPELNLHPQFQNNFFKQIHDSPNQFIYTTHSIHFIDIGEWKNIIRISTGISPDKSIINELLDNKSIENHLNEIAQYYQDKTLFIRENNELFFAHKVIIIEGPVDKYGHTIIAQKLGKDFSQITFISANGKQNIKYYILICKTFGIDYCVLYDEDSNGKDKTIESISLGKTISYLTSFETVLGFGNNSKTSSIFQKIESLSTEMIPNEIIQVINQIDTFVKS